MGSKKINFRIPRFWVQHNHHLLLMSLRTDDWSIPKKQKRPVAKTLLQLEKQNQNRNLAIVAAYKTGAYSQREIAEHYGLHPSTVGVIVRTVKNSQFGT